MQKFKRLLSFENLVYLVIFLIYGGSSYYYYTPSNDIIFWDFDSRTNIDEFIQILKPSGIWDFIYDSAFGNYTVYGRIYEFLIACLMFPIQKITSFSYPVSAFIVHLLVMYTGLMILTKSLIKDKILSILVFISLLMVCVDSKIMIKTTSLEVFIFSLIVLILINENIKFRKNILYFLFGIISGIKFVNIIYPAIFFLIDFKSLTIKKFLRYFLYGLFGLVAAQPYILTPRGFKDQLNFIIETINYKENYIVTPVDWLNLIVDDFNILYLVPILFVFIIQIRRFSFSKFEIFLILAPTAQVLSYFFSENLIRSHYLNLPISLLIIFLVQKVRLSDWMRYTIIIVFMIVNINYFIDSADGRANIAKFSSYSSFQNSLYLAPSYLAMNEVNSFVLNDLIKSDDNLIWWQASGLVRPYSEFHWGSTEDPSDVDYYYKDIWGDPRGFAVDRCADFGGVAVVLVDEKNISDVIHNFEMKNFILVKSFEYDFMPQKYYVFYNSFNKTPKGC